MSASRSLLCASLLLVASCVSGPNYKIPDKALYRDPRSASAFAAAERSAFSPVEPPDHWWLLYNNQKLDGYVAEALAANADLRAADANLRRATYVIQEAKAGRTIQTVVGGSSEISRVGGFTQPIPGTAYAYDLGVGVSYPLDLAGGVKRGIEAARANSEAAAAARDMVRVAIAAAVARNYADVCSAAVTLAAVRRVLEVQRQTLDMTQRLFQAGRGTAFDVTRAKTAVDQSEIAIPSIIAGRQADLFELGALMGRPPSDYPRDAEACDAPPSLDRLVPVGDGMALLRRRSDVRAAERTLAAATANIGVEAAQLYPQVSIGGSIGVGGPLSNLGSLSSVGGALGPLLSWTFPNRAATRARVSEAGAEADQAAAEFDGTVIEALRQTETALSAYARELDRDRASERARADAAMAADQAAKLFRSGRTSLLDVLTAQAALANAEAASAQSRAALIDRQVDVFLSLGGGWQVASGGDKPG